MRRYATSKSTTPYILTPSAAKSASNVKFLDASWFMPNSTRHAREEFLSKRIPGAQFLDLDEVASPHELGLKHMMPSNQVFAEACEKFGVEPSSHVVLYDTHGVFSSPRALFMFRSFGHSNSSIIDGGLPRWETEGLPLTSEPAETPKPTEYQVPAVDVKSHTLCDPGRLKFSGDMIAKSYEASELVLDARSKGRFLGTNPEPRPGLSSGHMPNSMSLPFNIFLRKNSYAGGEYTTFLPVPELRKALVEAVGEERTQAILNGSLLVTTSCGSGMTAAVLWLGLKMLGVAEVSLYDESWTGYAMRADSPIQKA
ncbi:Rhodanese-like protein [Fistulina hepatica ATCC 64428]|uniref:Rhodanese-like protein n=1 Tax=Fistulina hepatica ATCC 64428 TaxID=1128425 RepID=A0A0D7A2W9_9AGAR|nr:Rhodanese-like protein [Fistulina hepatica ATCC 64428]